MNSNKLTGAVWRKSSRSNAQANCVEVAFCSDGDVALRDTKDAGDGPVMFFTPGEWDAFVSGVELGEFRRPPRQRSPQQSQGEGRYQAEGR
jgi:hypothetical protein